MVTSRSGRRWVFPKGLIDPGHTPAEAALIEAWEEAGVVGTLDPDPVGNYVYDKWIPRTTSSFSACESSKFATYAERGFRGALG